MRYFIFLSSILILVGCKTPVGPANETILTEKQQKAFLSKSKPARHFGYQVFPIARNEIGMRGSARLHPNHRAVVPMEKKRPLSKLLDVTTATLPMHLSIPLPQIAGWNLTIRFI